MRTTLVLSDAAYEVARSVSIAQHRSLGEVISEMVLSPRTSANGLNAPNELGIITFNAPEPLTVERVKELLDDE